MTIVNNTEFYIWKLLGVHFKSYDKKKILSIYSDRL